MMQDYPMTMTMVKQKISDLPENRLQEVYDFIDFLVRTKSPEPTPRIKKLEGIWAGLGFERLADVEQEICELRRNAESSLQARMDQCTI